MTEADMQEEVPVESGAATSTSPQATGRSERTARQHAAAVYQKAGLGSRAELSADSLEDLLLPGQERRIVGPAGDDERAILKAQSDHHADLLQDGDRA